MSNRKKNNRRRQRPTTDRDHQRAMRELGMSREVWHRAFRAMTPEGKEVSPAQEAAIACDIFGTPLWHVEQSGSDELVLSFQDPWHVRVWEQSVDLTDQEQVSALIVLASQFMPPAWPTARPWVEGALELDPDIGDMELSEDGVTISYGEIGLSTKLRDRDQRPTIGIYILGDPFWVGDEDFGVQMHDAKYVYAMDDGTAASVAYIIATEAVRLNLFDRGDERIRANADVQRQIFKQFIATIDAAAEMLGLRS